MDAAVLSISDLLSYMHSYALFNASSPFKIVHKYKDIEISLLDDIQKLKSKDLRAILKSNSESTGGMRAVLAMKVYALPMRHVLPSSSGENREELPTDIQDLKQN